MTSVPFDAPPFFEAPLLPVEKIDQELRWSRFDNLHEVNTSGFRSSRVLHMGDPGMIIGSSKKIEQSTTFMCESHTLDSHYIG